MMKNYALYYSYKGIGDVLIVMFDDKKPTRNETKGRVTIIYHDDEIIGYNIFNVKEIIKIKNEGMIYYPNPALVSVLNTILINEGVKPLDILEESGYMTAEVIKKDDESITLSLGNKEATAKADLNIGDKVVVALKDTFLYDGSVVKDNAHVCTYKELGIKVEEDQILLLDEDAEIGKDFFSSEVR